MSLDGKLVDVADRGLDVIVLKQSSPIPLDLAFTCFPGQVLALFGPSGSRKTTILRSVAGLYSPASARGRIGASCPPATLNALQQISSSDQTIVQLQVGWTRLLAEVTTDAVDKLNIREGQPLHALIKSVSLEVRMIGNGSAPRTQWQSSPDEGARR